MEPLKKGTILLEPLYRAEDLKNTKPLSYSTGNCEERNLCVYCTCIVYCTYCTLYRYIYKSHL